jgi:two-component system sensor histidine kinase/response regulator
MSIPLSPPLGRLLVVDDEARLMNALCDTLRDKGYEVTGATTGEAALTLLRDAPVDLLLTDLTMPGMDGIALLQAAREIDPQLVAIMMTGHATVATAVQAMQVGAFDYILKPFKLSVILPVLTRALAVRQLRVENAVLQKRVGERAAELEVANKELEAFSFSIAHDLRAPLRAINGFAGMMRQECAALLPPNSKKHLEQIVASATQMNQLVEDLLKFARFSALPLSRSTVVTTDLVAKVLQELHAVPGSPAVAVRVGPLPDCQADAVLLKQVWVNLLSNAFKFTQGKPAPQVEISSRIQGGKTVYFVRDNGAGFDMKYAAKLFGAFQRLHATGEFEGTGIGLSIVQRILQRHGGRIWCEAKVNEGATFYFTVGETKDPAA